MNGLETARSRLVERRVASGLDVASMASRMGTSIGTVRTFESPTSNPTIGQMASYAAALDVDIVVLLGV